VLAVGELSYKATSLALKGTYVHEFWADQLGRPAGTYPQDYPMATIFAYVAAGRDLSRPSTPAEASLSAAVFDGLRSHGQKWPTYQRYPAWLKEHLEATCDLP
jgi:hypothetical protein